MVSIRRRRLLGLCSGHNMFMMPLPKFSENGYTPENRMQNTKPFSVHPMPSSTVDEVNKKPSFQRDLESSNPSASTTPKEQHTPEYPEIRRRKRHRRKQSENQESCLMRGVYFKNMKWQAAIKVDKKQIHLGTVSSQEEAARLYDRAAFMCGREPNFELSEEEKEELKKFNWDEFLALTRSAITNKKQPRRNGLSARRTSQNLTPKSEIESETGGSGRSASDEAVEELDISGT